MAQELLFAKFKLDTSNRQLWCDKERIELNPRYLDALILLANNQGQLLSKQRFFEEVWTGMVVSDDALTQCISALRKTLGDSATQSKFIETLPKHGYRFIAQVEHLSTMQTGDSDIELSSDSELNHKLSASFIAVSNPNWRMFTGGILGAAIAGLGGGIVYASIVMNSLQGDLGQLSVLFVMITLTLILTLLAGATISAALILTKHYSAPVIIAASAAASGFLGAIFKLLGVDTLQLLFGYYPQNMTGALEGILLGAAIASAFLLAKKQAHIGWQIAIFAAGLGIFAGLVISFSEGQLMIGSLLHLAKDFPQSLLNKLALFPDPSENPSLIYLLNVLEATWFTVCMCLGLVLANKAPIETEN